MASIAHLARPGANDEGRMEVLHAAAEAFNAKGYTLTTIDDIADRMSATKGRVYHYYRTKADIFLDVHLAAMELMLARVGPLARGEGTPSDRLYAMAAEHARLVMDEFTMQRAAIPAGELRIAADGASSPDAVRQVIALRDEYEQLYAEVIRDGLASGEFHAEADRLLTKFLLGALNWITMWFRRDGGADPELIASECASFVLHGVRQVG